MDSVHGLNYLDGSIISHGTNSFGFFMINDKTSITRDCLNRYTSSNITVQLLSLCSLVSCFHHLNLQQKQIFLVHLR